MGLDRLLCIILSLLFHHQNYYCHDTRWDVELNSTNGNIPPSAMQLRGTTVSEYRLHTSTIHYLTTAKLGWYVPGIVRAPG